MVHSKVFKRMLTNKMKEVIRDVIEFPADVLHVILEYLYTGKVTEKTLTIEIVAEALHLLEPLNLQIIEFI